MSCLTLHTSVDMTMHMVYLLVCILTMYRQCMNDSVVRKLNSLNLSKFISQLVGPLHSVDILFQTPDSYLEKLRGIYTNGN